MIRWLPLLLLPLVPGVAQVRDTPVAVPAGTARLSGVVRTDDTSAAPLRGAVVTLTGDGLPSGRGAITDDEGRFSFERLPSGRYTLSATKAPFITTAYGARRPGQPGTPIVVAAGQDLKDVALRLPRGAVITGRIVDAATGAPVADLPVMAARVDALSTSSGPGFEPPRVATDDRGQYRLFGLAPGDYVVIATPSGAIQGGVIGARADADVDALLASLSQRQRTPGAAPAPASEPLVPPPPTYGFGAVYYPGVAAAADATPVRVAAGEERTGIDLILTLVRTAAIEGQVAGDAGGRLPAVRLILTAQGPSYVPPSALVAAPQLASPPGPDGRFQYVNVPPGRYTITAESSSAANRPTGGFITNGVGGVGPPPVSGVGPRVFATAEVAVNGEDLHGVTLSLRPALRVTGRITTDVASPDAPFDPTSVRVGLTRVGGSGFSSTINGTAMGEIPIPMVPVRADGSFEIAGVLPGTYHVRMTASKGSWWLRSATVGDRDVVDYPLTVGTGDIDGVTVVLSARHARLAGTLQTADGHGVAGYDLLLFSADRALWQPDARRVRSTRPATDGSFVFADVVPGDYVLAMLTDFDPSDMRDPAFLDRLAASAIKVSIGEGEEKHQDIGLAQ
jgi:Carboxypeptidase regulatory-like domain